MRSIGILALAMSSLLQFGGPAGSTTFDLSSVTVDTKADEILGTLPVQKRYVFGSKAKAAEGSDVAIRNQADLAREFDAFQTWTGKVSIASELERYQTWNDANHVFGAGSLTLTGKLDRSVWKAPYKTIFGEIGRGGFMPGTPLPIAGLGLKTTAGIERGQIAAVQGRGAFYVSDLVADQSIAFQPVAGALRNPARSGVVAFLPAYALRLTKPTQIGRAGQTMLWLESIPDGLQPGAMVGWATEKNSFLRNDDYRVPTINRTANLAMVQKAMPPKKAGDLIVFTPPITSGQIWSKLGLDLGKETYAIDFQVVLPGDSSGGFDAAGISTRDALDAVPKDYPWGAWPALWLYGKNNGQSPHAGDEIDVLEGYYDLYRGPRSYSGANHGGDPNTPIFYREDANWTKIDGTNRRFARPLSGERRLTVVVTPDRVLRFVDGVLMKDDAYGWRNPRPAQIGVNLAIGSLDGSGPMNLLTPLAEANFAGMKFGIRSITVHGM